MKAFVKAEALFNLLLRLRLDVVGQPTLETRMSMVVGELERIVKHTKPSNNPSPVVAQLGTTYHTLSFS